VKVLWGLPRGGNAGLPGLSISVICVFPILLRRLFCEIRRIGAMSKLDQVGLAGERLVSKRRDRPYRGGQSKDWVKVKNRKHPAMEGVKDAFS
jgi:hypothetical protein